MINAQIQAEEIRGIENDFLQMTAHPYLKQYIIEPEIDNDLISFLLEILKNTNFLSADEKKEQILSAVFVQSAFMTHENVIVKDDKNDCDHQKKPTQLTVLAGDFFSSLYYYMLVKKAHQRIIPVFSHAIQRINEEKMSLHFFSRDSETELMDRIVVVEGCFIKDIAFHYNEVELAELAETFFILKRLVREKNTHYVADLSAISASVYNFLESKHHQPGDEWLTDKVKRWLQRQIDFYSQKLIRQWEACIQEDYPYLQDTMSKWMNV
ncbi:heptaprenyl diphosphate synthase component 1 [Alteribacillus sp. HJP-4]|uniref:heptaprenyl diphosphate synthase component 1 n=1 Tax=Alteribacillus sp. HJP-4 TaxID=2775394 RepID=UPI0035CD27BF